MAPTTTSTNKPSLAVVASNISNEYPEIFTCPHKKMGFEADFKLLVRTFVSERDVRECDFPEFDRIKSSPIDEIMNREMTKAYDAKAQAAGKPTLLKLAAEEAKGRSSEAVNREAREEMAAMMQAMPLSKEQQAEFGKMLMEKVKERLGGA